MSKGKARAGTHTTHELIFPAQMSGRIRSTGEEHLAREGKMGRFDVGEEWEG